MGIILVVAFYGYLVVGVCWLIVSPKGRRLCRKQGEFWSTLVELFCGPVVYTVILICRNGIEELKLNVKQCKYAFSSQIKIDVLNYMSGGGGKNKVPAVGDYTKTVYKKSVSEDESRKILVFRLLKSFVSIFESFPQLLLQCYVYFIARREYEDETSFWVFIQFYISIFFSLLSTLRSIYRLLTNDLFAKGLKKAFDVTAFGVFAGFGAVALEAHKPKIYFDDTVITTPLQMVKDAQAGECGTDDFLCGCDMDCGADCCLGCNCL